MKLKLKMEDDIVRDIEALKSSVDDQETKNKIDLILQKVIHSNMRMEKIIHQSDNQHMQVVLLNEQLNLVNDEFKQVNDELKQISDEAVVASKSKSQFLANMSHEIRTPLNGVIGLSQLLSLQSLETEPKQMVSKLCISSNLLKQLINDILDISKIESGKLKLEYSEFNIRETVKACLLSFEKQINDRGVQLISQIDPSVPELLVSDSSRLSQILLNLVGNALKFTPFGTISISISIDIAKSTEAGVLLYIKVTDTGVGIVEEEQHNIFSNFIQADNSISRKFGGSGLGLSICKHLVELMGGKISLSSQLGEGSTFLCQIPMRKLTSPANSTVKKDIIKIDQEVHVLVVDDEEINRYLAKGLLEIEGMMVTLADSGEQALELAQQKEFDVILMDIHMPGLNGWDITQLIRTSPIAKISNIPIIGLTADVLKESREKSLEVGMNSVVAKPFLLQDLLEQIQKFVIEKK